MCVCGGGDKESRKGGIEGGGEERRGKGERG